MREPSTGAHGRTSIPRASSEVYVPSPVEYVLYDDERMELFKTARVCVVCPCQTSWHGVCVRCVGGVAWIYLPASTGEDRAVECCLWHACATVGGGGRA